MDAPTAAKARLTIGLTAHRDLLPSEEPALREAIRRFFLRLQAEFPQLPLLLVSALAEGGDQLVAEEALAMGIEVLAPLPMPRAEYERDFRTPEALAKFRGLLARVEVRELSLQIGVRREDLAEQGVARSQQYAQLGIFISSHCQLLLALWDGRPGTAVGGTAEVVHFHIYEEMPALGRRSAMPSLLADDENDLVFHIVCSRDRSDGGPADGLLPGDERWLTENAPRPGDAPIPADYRAMFEQMEEFNRDAAKYAAMIATASTGLLPEAPPAPITPTAARLDAIYRRADWLAVHFQRRVDQSLRLTHGLAVLMGLAFMCYSELNLSNGFIAIFLGLFALGYVVYRIGARRDWHRKYLDYRALAEGLRVQLYWHLADVVPTDSIAFAHDSFLQKQDVELGWIRHVMRGASLYRDRLRTHDRAWLDWVGENWIGHRDPPSAQLGYYVRKTHLRERQHATTRALGMLALGTGLGIALLLLVAGQRIAPGAQPYLQMLMGLLPLIAGVREAYSFKKADKELIKQYRFMARIFERVRMLFDASDTDAMRREALRSLGAACLEEHAEWLLMHRQRPLEHNQLT